MYLTHQASLPFHPLVLHGREHTHLVHHPRGPQAHAATSCRRVHRQSCCRVCSPCPRLFVDNYRLHLDVLFRSPAATIHSHSTAGLWSDGNGCTSRPPSGQEDVQLMDVLASPRSDVLHGCIYRPRCSSIH
jgi:hypothetical protein